MTGNSETAMFEVPGSRLRELGEAERERDRLRAALEQIAWHEQFECGAAKIAQEALNA